VEILDIYGIVDGHEQVNVAGVSPGISPGSQFVFFFDMQALCYIGRTDNPFFSMNFHHFSPKLLTHLGVVGSEPVDSLADRIWRSVGPSGPNKVGGRLNHFFCHLL
jgi:glutathione-specific gamma-glutamylcyclotransferase